MEHISPHVRTVLEIMSYLRYIGSVRIGGRKAFTSYIKKYKLWDAEPVKAAKSLCQLRLCLKGLLMRFKDSLFHKRMSSITRDEYF